MHQFASLDEVAQTLEALTERERVARLPRRPGQKEERFTQLLGGERAEAPEPSGPWRSRSAWLRLEEEVAAIRQAMDSMR